MESGGVADGYIVAVHLEYAALLQADFYLHLLCAGAKGVLVEARIMAYGECDSATMH